MSYEDMFKMATSRLGISFSDYYDITPRELSLMFEGYVEKYHDDVEIQAMATRIAIINAIGKKKYKVFQEAEKEIQKIDKKEKQQALDSLKAIFS